MRKRHWPVLVETYQAGLRQVSTRPEAQDPTTITLALREKGWVPYRVWYEAEEELWVAKVVDWGAPPELHIVVPLHISRFVAGMQHGTKIEPGYGVPCVQVPASYGSLLWAWEN